VKSGTDFRSFGKITLAFDDAYETFSVDVEKIEVISSVEEDSYIKDITSKYMGNISSFFFY